MTDFDVVTVDNLLVATNPFDTDPVTSVIRYGKSWEPFLVDVFRTYVHEGDVVIDVGANIGWHTLQLGRLVGESGKVISFEPQSYLANQIHASVELNGMTARTVIYNLAVGDENKNVSIRYVDPTQFLSTGAVQIFTGDVTVEMITLDSLNLERVNFIKIDVELFENLVIRGATELIKRCKPIIAYEWFEGHASTEVHT
jgi:FkbM family methyltransferase